ncbi:MAG TPA: prepilin-type N-terminal cleavage/methylation domain-containing protein [Phycisphaerales bacterium]|jgi:prepilin-type N-terminal cleavage/methylation domain-containing protein|nr:prepilin-type N-terminal cleavage/methylation domain-containing protein [Phycisphaerales bacterium]
MTDTFKSSRTLALPRRFSGFTLIELLVVIAIIALLISIVLPGMAEARRLAYRVREMAAAEQKMVAYNVYASENRDAQFVGYAPWSVAHLFNNGGSNVLLHPDILYGGTYMVEGNCIKINGMRFAGATQMNLEALMIDKATFRDFNTRDQTPSASNPGYSPPTNLYDNLVNGTSAVKAACISYHPSLGINTTFLGGSADRGAFATNGPNVKWTNNAQTRHYTSTTSQLNFPSRIIVLGSARGVDVSSVGSYGSMGYGTQPPPWNLRSVVLPGWWEIVSPMRRVLNSSGNYQYYQPYTQVTTNGTPQNSVMSWTASNTDDKWDPNTDPAKWGFLDFRHKGLAVTAEADGHVEMASIKDLRDFRRWSNDAK